MRTRFPFNIHSSTQTQDQLTSLLIRCARIQQTFSQSKKNSPLLSLLFHIHGFLTITSHQLPTLSDHQNLLSLPSSQLVNFFTQKIFNPFRTTFPTTATRETLSLCLERLPTLFLYQNWTRHSHLKSHIPIIRHCRFRIFS